MTDRLMTSAHRHADRPHSVPRTVHRTGAGPAQDRRTLAGARHAREEQSRVRTKTFPPLRTVDSTRERTAAQGGGE